MADPFHRLQEAMADRYTLERELGAGGMATVYLAHDPRHNRKVAIKIMNAELAAIIGAARFLNGTALKMGTPSGLREQRIERGRHAPAHDIRGIAGCPERRAHRLERAPHPPPCRAD